VDYELKKESSMSVLPLVQLKPKEIGSKKHPLRTLCGEVKDFGPEFQKIVDDLVDTFLGHKIAIGLAAPQVGIQLKLAVINLNKDKPENTLVMVNPKVLSTGGKKDKKKESCMSLPDYAGEVERRHKIAIAYQDRFGKEEILEAEGFLARAIAHETDHLEGLLYVDRMSDPSQLVWTDIFKDD
jgi:peptide deformylase